jgi:hypothetical protein
MGSIASDTGTEDNYPAEAPAPEPYSTKERDLVIGAGAGCESQYANTKRLYCCGCLGSFNWLGGCGALAQATSGLTPVPRLKNPKHSAE